MSPLVPAADREQLSRVRASLAQDGHDLAMVGRDHQKLLRYAAAVALELGQHAHYRVEKYAPSSLEHLLADLTLARFDPALQRLATGYAASDPRLMTGVVLFIPDAQALSSAELARLLRLLRGTGHPRLRVVALFHGGATACEPFLRALGARVARWYLDDDPDQLPGFESSAHAPVHGTVTRRPANADHRTRRRAPRPAGVALAICISVALMFGPTLWPSPAQIVQLLERTPLLEPAASTMLAGERAPTFDTGALQRPRSLDGGVPER